VPALSYTLLIDGQPAEIELMAALERIEMEQHVDMADMLRLAFSTGLQDDGDWTIADADIFARLTPIRLEVTVGSGPTELLAEAYVTETNLQISNSPGASTFDVVAMDPTILMNLEEKVQSWTDMSDADIATQIFQEYNFMTDVAPTSPVRQEAEQTVMQRGTDIQFLARLARRNGYECGVRPDPTARLITGHFHPPRLDGSPQGVLSVSMGEATNINGLSVRFDMIRPQVSVANGLDIESQSDQSAQVQSGELSELGAEAVFGGDRSRQVLLSETGLAETGELQTYAQAATDRSSWALTANGNLNTAAYGAVLRAGETVNLRGAGTNFSGTYYVERVLHMLSGTSYEQYFTLRRNARGLTGSENFMDDLGLP